MRSDVITVLDALDLLRECLDDAAGQTQIVVDDYMSRPGSLLAHALAKRGLADVDLNLLPIIAEAQADAHSAGPALTLGALVALKAADRAQRAGSDWSIATITARAVVLKYVDLLPDSLFPNSSPAIGRGLPRRPGGSSRATPGPDPAR
jgi:hypothetical protein